MMMISVEIRCYGISWQISLNGWYADHARGRASRTPRSMPTLANSISGTVTTGTAITTSMSRTATSTTCSSCMPARVTRPAAAYWATMPFGAIAGSAASNLVGVACPDPEWLIGGIQIGNSSYWINKYTIQPENGGVGVFAHEYGHDLNLPDLYDTSGGVRMAPVSGRSCRPVPGRATMIMTSVRKPNHFGAWEKFQLGWLNYEVAFTGQKSSHKLGPAETNTKQAQGLFVVLPPKESHRADR